MDLSKEIYDKVLNGYIDVTNEKYGVKPSDTSPHYFSHEHLRGGAKRDSKKDKCSC
jgi:hypothetical protein